MNRSWRAGLALIGGLAAGIVIFAVGLELLLSSISLGECVNEVRAEYPSPDGRLKLVVFNRDCGATTGFNTMASLIQRDESLPDGADWFFAADTDHGLASTLEVHVLWQGPTRVLFLHDRDLRIFRNEKSSNGVVIEYKYFEPEPT